MPVSVIVGGQFGSEGKGKVAHFWAHRFDCRVAIRVGGPNSGHTVIDESGKPLILRHLPTAAILPNVTCILGPGSYVDPDILLDEVRRTGLSASRLRIDPNAVIITEEEIESEIKDGLNGRVGSTQTGTGAAVLRRIKRLGTIFAKDDSRLKKFVSPTAEIARSFLESGERLVVEGTQGFGLSLLHSPHYPFVTSRDTTAATFIAEAGISPLDVDEIIMVIRTFPIRVPGNSGPLPNEITWADLSAAAGGKRDYLEFTSVTKKVRRVATFDPEIVQKAILVNCPTHVVLNHLDYVDSTPFIGEYLSPTLNGFVEDIERGIGQNIDFVGLGPDVTANRRELVKSRVELRAA